MPGFNQTGPMGQGSMTGRKMGRCTKFGANVKNQNNTNNENQNDNLPEEMQGRGYGFGRACFPRGRGFGMGRQNRFRGGF